LLKKWRHIDPTLIVVSAVALLLRGLQPGIRQISWDEINLLFWSYRMAAYGDWLWLSGNRPTGGLLIAHSPLNNYLPALLYTITQNPEHLRLAVALASSAAVLCLYLTLRRYAGRGAAFIGGLLFAVAVPAIDMSRLVFHPAFSLPFIALWLLTGLLGYHEGKRWAQVAHWLCLGAAVQFQPANALLALPSLLLLVGAVAYRGMSRRLLLTTLAAWLLTALLFVPWGIGWLDAALNDEPAPPQNETPEVYDLAGAFFKYANSTTGANLWLQNSDDGDGWLPPAGRDLLELQAGVSLLCAAALFIIGLRRRARGLPLLLIGGLGLLGLLVFAAVPGGGRINDFYFIYSIIGACAALGVALAWLAQGARWRAAVVGIALAGMVGASLWLTYNRLRWLDGYGWQQHMRAPLSAYLHLLDDWTAAYEDVAILIEPLASVEATPTQQVYTWTVLTANHPSVRLIDRATGQGVPLRDGGTLLVGLHNSPTLAALPGAQQRVGRLATTGEPALATLFIDPAALPPLDYLPETISRFAIGAHLLGMDADGQPQPGESWRLRLFWRTEGESVSDLYHFSLRLTDRDGNLYGQQDFPALDPVLWRADELIVNFADLPIADDLPPADDLRVQVWLYAYDDGETIAAVDDAGNGVAPWLGFRAVD
jgi:4-amino-4-deoxy-L-arabinose transferase-like glycosyltransferase